jgi:tRNA A37 N6-isopentenylltransferase MiaA
MNEIRRNSRVSRALEVIKLTEEGMTVVDACQEVEMPRSTYYFIIKSEREALAEVQRLKRGSQISQLLSILIYKETILDNLLAKAKSEDATVREIVEVLKYIDKKLDELKESLNHTEYDKDYAASILTGPKQVPGVSRFTSEPPIDY